MRWLDGILLGAAQWICDRTQILTGGVTKFRFQKWANILFIIFFWGGWICLSSGSSGDFASGAINLFNTFLTVYNVRQTEAEEIEFLASGEIKYHSQDEFSNRIVLLITCAVMMSISVFFFFFPPRKGWFPEFGEILYFWSIVCLVMWGYFAACVPKPPCKSKVRQWCEKALQWIRDPREPALIPEPSS